MHRLRNSPSINVSQRTHFTASILFCVVVALSAFRCDRDNDSPPPPNILFIAIDDLNDWVGVLGGHPNALTPNIDRLAAEGTLFLNAHTQAPLCGPSRASLMSGLRPSTTGVYGQTEDSDLRAAHPLLQRTTFLPEYFGERGYKTMGIGKLFHRHAPEGVFEMSGGREPGFGPKPESRRYWDQPETSTDWGPFPEMDAEMPDYRSADWAIEQLTQSHGRPFFLGVGFLRPHVPWHVPAAWFDLHPKDNVALPPYRENDMDDVPDIGRRVAEVWQMPTTEWAIENGHWPAIVQAYLASVSFVDEQVGRVLDALEASGHAGNTVIVLFSDHGYHIGEKNRFAKHSLWERATRVPLVFSGPGIGAGETVGSAVELLDLYPTLVELAGLEANNGNEGNSLVALLRDPSTAWPYAAVTTYGQNNHGVKKGNTRYIRYEDGSEEFYDHRDDPNEWNNGASDPANRAVMDQLAAYLPTTNESWSALSQIDTYEYFMEQRARSLGGGRMRIRAKLCKSGHRAALGINRFARILLLLVIVPFACGPEKPDATSWCRLDGSNPATVINSGTTTRLQIEEVWRRGGAVDDQILAGAFNPAIDLRGRIAIPDPMLQQVIFIDKNGEWKGPVLTGGEGPGEVMVPVASQWSVDGSLLTLDVLGPKTIRTSVETGELLADTRGAQHVFVLLSRYGEIGSMVGTDGNGD